MDIQTLITFFTWCTILNLTVFLFWTAIFMFIPESTYRTQSKWFPISRENYNLVYYSFLGLFKIVFLVFNVTPLLTLLIINGN